MRTLRSGLLYLTCTAALLAVAAPPPALADIEAIVTSVAGNAKLGQDPVRLHSPIPLEQTLVTDEDASCSVLLDRDTVVQFCGRTSLRIVDDKARQITIVRIDEGSTRTTARPRGLDNPLEIHTPIAVAVIVGTVITTTVDPTTGDTTFAVEEGSIRVRSSDPAISSMITVEAGEQVTIRRGQPPEGVESYRGGGLNSQDCMATVRMASIKKARDASEPKVTDEITKDDIALPTVGAPPTRRQPLPEIPTMIGEQESLCSDVLQCAPPPELFVPAPPQPCVGIPGDHCSF